MKLTLKKEAIYVSIAFNVAETALSSLADWIRDMERDYGPYWLCADQIALRWHKLLEECERQVQVKKAFGHGLHKDAFSTCEDLEGALKGLREVLGELDKIRNGGVDRWQWKTISRKKPKKFRKLPAGEKIIEKSKKVADGLRGLKERISKRFRHAFELEKKKDERE